MRTVKLAFEFTVDDDADIETLGDAVFEALCDPPVERDLPYESCDGWTRVGGDDHAAD